MFNSAGLSSMPSPVCETTMPPNQKGSITARFEILIRNVEALEAITNELSSKLMPLCRPNQMVKPCDPEKKMEPISELAEGISSISQRVDRCQQILRERFNLLDF